MRTFTINDAAKIAYASVPNPLEEKIKEAKNAYHLMAEVCPAVKGMKTEIRIESTGLNISRLNEGKYGEMPIDGGDRKCYCIITVNENFTIKIFQE